DVAADHLGLQVSRGGLEYLLNKLHSPRGRGLLAFFGTRAALDQVQAARVVVEQFFLDVQAWLAKARGQGSGVRSQTDAVRVRETDIVANGVSEEFTKLATCLDDCAKRREADEEKIELTAAAERCRALALGLEEWLRQGLEGQVYWVEVTGGRVTPRV